MQALVTDPQRPRSTRVTGLRPSLPNEHLVAAGNRPEMRGKQAPDACSLGEQ